MENDLKKEWKTNQSTKINLIGCDTIVNSHRRILEHCTQTGDPLAGRAVITLQLSEN